MISIFKPNTIKLTKVDGNDEKGVEQDSFSESLCFQDEVGVGVGIDSPVGYFSVDPNLPIFFSHSIKGGSLPSAQAISISCNPRSSLPLAHTAANASPICRNGTTAVPRLGLLGGAGLSDTRISPLSVPPNCRKRDDIDSGLVRLGCEVSVHFRRIVVSRVPNSATD